MSEQPLQVVKDINQWLQRAGLSQDDLQRMSVHEQASVGRQWQSYQADVKGFQVNNGIPDRQLASYAMVSAHAVPRLDGAVPQKQQRITHDDWVKAGQERMNRYAGHR